MQLKLIPSQEERRQLFYWLKKASSYTAYERVGRYYKAWVDKFKLLYDDSQRHPDPEHGVLMAPDKIVTVMSCYAAFEEALARLKRGSKRPFVWLGQSGHFSESGRVVDYWMEATRRGEEGDNEVKEMYSPHWPAVKRAREELVTSWCELGVVEQERHTDVPAKVGITNDLEIQCRFPLGNLPEVPIPPMNVLVQTGSIVPSFGVWEPVKADLSGGFAGLFKKPLIPQGGQFELDGCMNYLHQGSAAPTIFTEGDDPTREGRPTVWRLLWEDTRYRDGMIPDEEHDYVFFDIKAAGEPPQTTSTPSGVSSLIQAQTGEVAVRSGVWSVLDDLHGRASLLAGDKLPVHEGRSVRWVWVSD